MDINRIARQADEAYLMAEEALRKSKAKPVEEVKIVSVEKIAENGKAILLYYFTVDGGPVNIKMNFVCIEKPMTKFSFNSVMSPDYNSCFISEVREGNPTGNLNVIMFEMKGNYLSAKVTLSGRNLKMY